MTLALTLSCMLACSVKPGGDTEAGSEGADTGATLGHSSAPGDDPTDGPTPDSTGAPTTTDGASATGADTQTSTGEAPTLCQQLCQHIGECQPDADPDTCATLCEAGLASATPECRAATVAMDTCYLDLDCEHLASALAGELGHPCGSEQIDRDSACTGAGDSCDTGAGGAFDGTSCMIETQCPGEPLRRMQCDTQTCICLEDAAEVGSCPVEGACLPEASGQLADKAMTCCGFPDAGP